MKRRLISMLAAGVLAAGTIFITAAASAGTAAIHHGADCSLDGNAHLHITASNGVNYYAGTPVNTFSGAVVRLKPFANSTTLWTACFTSSTELVLLNRGLAMTSRDFSPGGFVTVTTTTAPGGNGFASQRWFFNDLGNGTATFQNEKTGLFLRVRNSCCFFGQTVTTGAMPTDWNITF
jgi:hypothetical protein